jgi:hypothetical protein
MWDFWEPESRCFIKWPTMLWPLILTSMSLINRKYHGPPTNFSSKPTSQLKTTYNTVSFHRQYAYGTHHQPALLCHASPWINLKLWPKVTNSKSHLFFCTVYIHVIFYAYFENYLVCSRWCIIISIDGTSYKVEVSYNEIINLKSLHKVQRK